MAEACSSLFSKTRPSEVFSLLRSISGLPSPISSDLPNFQNCHTPVDCANQRSSHLQSHFSTQTPKPFRSTEKTQMNTIRTAHCNTLHSTFCSPFSSLELYTTISQHSTSNSSCPDKITYLLLTYLPQFVLHFFYISTSLTFLGQLSPFHQPGNNRQSSPFSNPENPLIHFPHIDLSLLLPVPPTKEWF